MQRIRFTKDHKQYKKGDVVVIDNNEAFGLIDSGTAEISKDMTPDDYKQAGVNHDKPTGIRPNNSLRR